MGDQCLHGSSSNASAFNCILWNSITVTVVGIEPKTFTIRCMREKKLCGNAQKQTLENNTILITIIIIDIAGIKWIQP